MKSILDRAVIIIVLALLFAIPALGDTSSGNPQTPDPALLASIEKYCEPTESSVLKELKANPNDVSLQLKYAGVLLDEHKVKEALIEYTKIHKANPKNSDASLGMGCCYAQLGNWQQSLVELKAACQADPLNVNAVLVYAAEAVKYHKFMDAKPALLVLAHSSKPKAALCYWKIAERVVGDDFTMAQSFAREAHSLDPKAYPRAEIHSKSRSNRVVTYRDRFTPIEDIWLCRIPLC